MISPWALLLTDDPSLSAITARLADSAGVPVLIRGVGDPVAGAGPPSLVLLGADRLAEPLLPAATAGVPRVLVAAGEPAEGLWRAAHELRAEQVILLPEAEHALLARLTQVLENRNRQALVLAVVGGCGGAGASVLAAALARAGVRITRSLLIDLDPLGSGLDLLLGAEDEPGLRWPDLTSARGQLMPGSLAGALPVIDGIHVLSWDRSPTPVELPAAAAVAVLDGAQQEYGVVILDLPRSLDAAASAAARAADLGLIVVPAEVRAAASARRVATTLRHQLADVRLVVRGPAPTGLRAEAICAALGLRLAGTLKPEPGIAVALDRGEPPGLRRRGPLGLFARELLARELAVRELVGERPERSRAS